MASAVALVNKLVVITHKYKEDFCESKDTHLSLLAENVKDVFPSATSGGQTYIERVERKIGDGEGATTEYEDIERSTPLGVSLMPMIALAIRAIQQIDSRLSKIEHAIDPSPKSQ